MKLNDTTRTVTLALAIIVGVLLAPQTAKAQTAISDFIFDINTKDDDKDQGEPVRFQIIKNDKEVVYDSGWIHGDFAFQKGGYDSWRGKPNIPFTLADAPNLKLRVEKQGDKAWKASFKVRGNGDTLVLLSDTPKVLFGKRNDTNIDKPLLGTDGVKATHLDGGSIHIFSFTAKP